MKHIMLGLIIVFVIFSVGCNLSPAIKQISDKDQKITFNYEDISALNNKYLLTPSDNIDVNTADRFMIRRAIVPLNFNELGPQKNFEQGGFAAHLWVFKNINMKETMDWDANDLREFDTFQLYSDISLSQCEMKIISEGDISQYIAKCADSETTIFISVVSKNKELAHQVLNDIYSAISS